ncbi:hypothetical protein BB561_005648 [Smittium simulii]|uniref:Dephospho-CoA kinase n=1 Tax=Smittium simulii TaxID=133385 RepID=A0A2T9Y9B5_9FUNG|nr:hypothetical protein BB561_005648 [Smittium simulii]
MEPGASGYKNVLKAFGSSVLENKSCKIDRKKLGDIIFNDTDKRQLLNRCTHPVVRAQMIKQVCMYYLCGYPLCVLDIPLLFESDMHRLCHKTIVIHCSEQIQLQRLMKRDDIDHDKAIVRIEAQMPLSQKIKLADFTIDNNGSVTQATQQLDSILVKTTPSYFKVYSMLIAPLGILGSAVAMFIPSKFSFALCSLVGSVSLLIFSMF